MTTSKPSEKPLPKFQKTQHSNIVRYNPSGTYYARFRVGGKLIHRSLKTDRISVAQLRLPDMQKEERDKLHRGVELTKGRVLFGAAVEAYRENGFRPIKPRNRKDAQALKPAALAYYEQRVKALFENWPGLESTDVKQVSPRDCRKWADQARRKMSPTVFNHTLGLLRQVFEFAIERGAIYYNPAHGIIRERESAKHLDLPGPEEFQKLVTAIENGGSGFSKDCANLVRFLAFSGMRVGEAAYVKWADCDLRKGIIKVRGHPETGLKNRRPGEMRTVPMIPEMKLLLEKLRQENPEAQPNDSVMGVRECQKSLTRAAKELGLARLTHHDLRHLFATRAIESGIDVMTIAQWLGHSDNGALLLRRYGHLRQSHSESMAQKLSFQSAEASAPAIKEPGSHEAAH